MKISQLLIAILCVLLYQSPFAQTTTPKGLQEKSPDKCYGKCIMPRKYETYTQQYVVYTGDATIESVDLETVAIEISPATSEWVKKKADGNCLSADPNDCLVWCLIQKPGQTKELVVLKDTTQSKNYEIQEVSITKLVNKGGNTEVLEILCKKSITKDLIAQIQNALRNKGYYPSKNAKRINSKVKMALSSYQRAHKLPVGKLDFETLKHLGIEI